MRAHAKRRFAERFGLNLNRDALADVERRIRDGRSVLLSREEGTCRARHLVEIAGQLIAVVYDRNSGRIVTALPDEALSKVPAEVLRLARLRLLPAAQDQVLSDIRAGRSEIVRVVNDDVCLHRVQFDGAELVVPYSRRRNRLIQQSVRRPRPHQPVVHLHDLQFRRLDLPEDVVESFRQQIRTGQARFLWRFSWKMAFYELRHGLDEHIRIGYNKRSFYAWAEPPESMPE